MQMMFALREWFTRRFSRICSMHEIYPIYLKARGRRKMIQGQRAKYPNFWPTSHVNAPLLSNIAMNGICYPLPVSFFTVCTLFRWRSVLAFLISQRLAE